MAFPASTYRVQFHKGFKLKDLKKILPYLHKLGITTIYASPIFQARNGSTHGYDVTDPLKVNEEIGSLKEWRRLKKKMDELNMSWLQDIVPNHMALSSSNPWIYSILERGPLSPYYQYFDIDWNHHDKELNAKLMMPFLGADLPEVIKKGELKLQFNDGFNFTYYDQIYPLSEQSYPVVLKFIAENSLKDLQNKKLQDFIEKLKIPSEDEGKWCSQKKRLVQFLNDDLLKETIASCESINEEKDEITNLLQRQYFHLTHWRTTEKKINYRRFFSINDLICLRMEDEVVFKDYHSFIKSLCDEKLIDGLRIDHIDGLFNPGEYLNNLRTLVGDDKLIVVEKILEQDEKLPEKWPVQGSSGYDFLATVNQVLTNTNSEKTFTEHYNGIKGNSKSYPEQVFHSKENFVKRSMGGELQNLSEILKRHNLLPENDSTGIARWKEALGSFLAAWPVYRIYSTSFPLNIHDKEKIHEAYDLALQMLPGLKDELDHLLNLFLGDADFPEKDMLYFLQRCQQFTGPLAAKGVEDTMFYRYNLLISHNEVGDTPEVFGMDVKSFHRRMQHRQKLFPYAINGTSTHDTKRGEDARMRINSLADIPEKWFNQWQVWRKMNKSARVQKNVPDENEEYFIYQSLIGAYTNQKDESLLPRTRAYIQKCLREAKVYSNWSEPNEKYEKGVSDFLENLFGDPEFTESLDRFQRETSLQGIYKSINQTILKVCSPGIPDIYQGSEFLDLSYVDPDNRRAVDYKSRIRTLNGISAYNSPSFRSELLKNHHTGRIKMFVLYHTLQLRLHHPELFTLGSYLPLKVSERYKNEILAFARVYKDDFCIVAVPLKLNDNCEKEPFYPDSGIWKKASVKLPEGFPKIWKQVFTEKILNVDKGAILLKDAFSEFPVAVLKSALHEI